MLRPLFVFLVNFSPFSQTATSPSPPCLDFGESGGGVHFAANQATVN